MKKIQESIHNLFQPTFGNRPEKYIGRDGVIEQFMAGLREPVGSRNRCTLFLGQRGMGKTATGSGCVGNSWFPVPDATDWLLCN